MNKPFEAITVAQKASADTALALMKSSLDTIERLAAINLNTMRDALEASRQSNMTASATGSGEYAAAQPSLQLTRAYYHRVYDLMTEMQERLTQVMQAHYTAMSDSASAGGAAMAAAPTTAGGEAFSAAMKTMLDSSAQTFDRLNQISHQLKDEAAPVAAAPMPETAAEKVQAPKDKRPGKARKS